MKVAGLDLIGVSATIQYDLDVWGHRSVDCPIYCHVRGTNGRACAIPDRGVDWDVFERTVQMRVGRIRWAPRCEVAGSFTDVIIRSAGMSGSNTAKVVLRVQWWNEELNRMRGETARIWQRTKARGGTVNWRRDWSTLGLGRRTAEGCVKQTAYQANCGGGNVDPWGLPGRPGAM
ncbi:hypothetical protein EVAR_89972_1 [Eumeta japonica]|uniref:Uncharacterized protein n=1 Tax=Eumeta variegata TaxID=151549 RepID=A0A4C2ADB0_EUMVA|nr:hypothetical protein EVAR_89972_1 [Eumeta japonica]